MNGLEKTIEVVNDIVTESDIEEKERQDALAYLESLKPFVPSYFAKWYESLPLKRMSYVLDIYHNTHLAMPRNVYEWISSLKRQMEMVLGDIERFGYRIESERLYVIKTPPLKFLPQEYYVIEHGNGGETKYQFTTDKSKATKFISNDAYWVKTILKIDWALEEVREDH